MSFELAFIGAGNMAEAIATAVIRAGVCPAAGIAAADPSEARQAAFRRLGIAIAPGNAAAAREAQAVLLCVKPQMMPAALRDIRPVLNPQQLIVTIAAGIGTAFVATALGPEHPWRIVRVMPNTPMLVGAGAAAICKGGAATDSDLERVRRLFEPASIVIEVNEPQMDTVTAVSGSGPAYFFYLCQHLIEAATRQGLSQEQARRLVYQTAAGAAAMLNASSDPPAELRRKVTSPGGTTQAAIELFDARAVGQAVQDAVAAAVARGRELGK